ncbi:GrpB family protein [uncultured Photobacterium sp.]|uniref:GrpB family protein n=1 Tax=uncultured Photobacterium sp. TaxID=173973 RepID=UPI002604B793|nr:GrpB family protein [uncultured Photobacterium sp.]
MSKRIIEVVSYDPKWAELFELESRAISDVVGQTVVNIHHIGSTSVTGLAAKPIIDILLEVTDLHSLDVLSSGLISLGYESKGEFGIAGRRFFQKGGNNRTHHLHAFKVGDSNVVRHIAFRDYLIAHPDIATEYGRLKTKVALGCNNDPDSYCSGKNDFIKYHVLQSLKFRT